MTPNADFKGAQLFDVDLRNDTGYTVTADH